MLHFTMTGFYAGQTYCGAPRNAEGQYAHYKQVLLERKDLCPNCLTVLMDTEEDD